MDLHRWCLKVCEENALPFVEPDLFDCLIAGIPQVSEKKDHLVVRFFEATRQHVRTEEEATEQSATTDGPTEGSSQEEDLQRVRGSWMMLEYVGCMLSDSLVTGQRPLNGCKSVSSGFHTALSFITCHASCSPQRDSHAPLLQEADADGGGGEEGNIDRTWASGTAGYG